MKRFTRPAFLGAIALFAASCDDDEDDNGASTVEIEGECPEESSDGGTNVADDDDVVANAKRLIEEGRTTFRFDTFGDEAFWGDQLRLHEAIAGEANGGVGDGVSPATALAVGLKVDVEALPQELVDALAAGEVDLTSPATTVALLQLDAVVGVTGFFNEGGSELTSMGIQCAFCHSTVDDSFAPGIGKRLDGWPNQDLDVGAIVALAPDLTPFTKALGVEEDDVRAVLSSWGPGKYDAELLLDGKAFQPDGRSSATVIPPALRLAGVNLHTYTGWGGVPYWNAFVAVTQMHGSGTFYDPRLDDAERFPLAARDDLGHVRAEKDRVTKTLAALHVYQLALPVPSPPAGSFDAEAAARGSEVFNGKARCNTCHVPPLYTEPGWNMHTGEEIGIDNFQAERSPDGRYRTAPLEALFIHDERGFYHDGRFATLDDVVKHYDETFRLGLSEDESADLVEFLKSL